MKTLIIKLSALACIVVLISFVFTTSSCNKDKTCHGKVTVVDMAGTGMANAKVHLAAPSVGGQVVYDGVTDGSGDVSFEVKLPAIFDVTATTTTSPVMSGTGVLRLDEAGKSNQITVKVQ
jgi:hypothetical protein